MPYYNYRTDDTVDKWVKEVSKGRSHIPRQLESKYVHEYQTTTSEARRTFVLGELIAYNAASFAAIALNVYHSTRGAKRIEPVDLLQEAIKVFIRKLDGFDPNKGARLITYYTRDVKTTLQRYVASNAMDIRQGSVYLRSIAAQISSVVREADSINEGYDTISKEEIAKKLGISMKTIALVEQFTSVTVVGVDDRMTDSSSGVQHSEKTYHSLFHLLHKKLAMLTSEQFSTVQHCLLSGDDIPTEILNLIK